MDSILIPLLILIAVVAGVLLLIRSFTKRSAEAKASRDTANAPKDPVELARESAAKLNQEQHRQLYSLIAQGNGMAAIKLYLQATGEGLRASRNAVGALAAHPQPFTPEAPAKDLLADDDDEPERFPYRYRAIVSKGDVTREVSSNMLNDEIYGRIRTLAKSGDVEGAALALTRHSDINIKQAREFIELLDD
jgi:Na+-transporting methylmalonyl-CoA/oxaloacetate decarboxylase gamma subunit